MCIFGRPQVPRGWQQVCQKANLPPDSRDSCSLFLSPDGKTFKTMDEVVSYSKVLDQEKLAKEQKKMEAKSPAKGAMLKTGTPPTKILNPVALPNWDSTMILNPVAIPAKMPAESNDPCPAAKKLKLDDIGLPITDFWGKKLKCIECDKSFFNLSRLEKHFKEVHIEATQLPSSIESCSICSQRWVGFKALNRIFFCHSIISIMK